MHQLTVFEMEEISGGALTDTLTDIVTWAAKEVGAFALVLQRVSLAGI